MCTIIFLTKRDLMTMLRLHSRFRLICSSEQQYVVTEKYTVNAPKTTVCGDREVYNKMPPRQQNIVTEKYTVHASKNSSTNKQGRHYFFFRREYGDETAFMRKTNVKEKKRLKTMKIK